MAPKRRYSNAHVSCGVQSISQLAHSTFFFFEDLRNVRLMYVAHRFSFDPCCN